MMQAHLETWIRWLLIGLLIAATVALVEARTIRSLRAELATLRAEREQVRAGAAAVWTRQSHDEFKAMGQWLHGFYADPAEGLGRAGGLCAGGAPDFDAVTRWVFGEFGAARAKGVSFGAASDAMRNAILKSDEYRAVHPEAGPPK